MAIAVAFVAALGWVALAPHERTPANAGVVGAPPAPATSAAVTESEPDSPRPVAFRMPSGELTRVRCASAQAVVAQVREGLAFAPQPFDAKQLAESAGDWLDPHGLLALAPDAPVQRVLDGSAEGLAREIEHRGRTCASAKRAGRTLAQWRDRLVAEYDRGRAEGQRDAATPEAADAPIPQSGLGLETAHELGRRAGALERRNAKLAPFVAAARAHFFPPFDEIGWSEAVLAATLRAYVPLVDPHGAWAPLDEESSVFDIDLVPDPPRRLWGRSTATAIGVRLDEDVHDPLAVGDVLLALDGHTTAGLPLEQIEQLGFVSGEARAAVSAHVLRGGAIVTLSIAPASAAPAASPADDAPPLPTTQVPYGSRTVAVIEIRDVRDDLGEALAATLAELKRHGEARLAGVVLDLRGNGGGSTDGAIAALGSFMPEAPLFPMKRRDGTVEIDRAPATDAADQWRGPVATLVDGSTASAAEMLAGALAVYRRGPSLGARTFGKGCAQEYLDDAPRVGVLRLTTLLYALPDGSPVQRVGITPTMELPFARRAPTDAHDREATLPHAPPTWRGPDVRDHAMVQRGAPAWSPADGSIGPCVDAEICSALRRLSAPLPRRTPVAKKR